MEIGPWLQRLLPRVEAYGARGPRPDPYGRASTCWISAVKVRTPEHNPPLYWLGRALDAVDAGGALEQFRERLVGAHGRGTCAGQSEQDQRAQDALVEACAYAWAAEHLGAPQFVPDRDGDRMLVRVPDVDAWLAPRRLSPAQTLETLLRQIVQHASAAGSELPAASGRLLYLDLYLNLQAYARDVGYEMDLTDPVREWVKHHGAEQRLGWVLTRPFQWGVPIESWY